MKFLVYCLRELWNSLLLGGLSILCSVTPLRGCKRLKLQILRTLGVKVEAPIIIGRQLSLINPSGITMGKGVVLGAQATIASYAPIAIGDDFLSAIGLLIHSGSHVPESLEIDSKPIHIGKRVWCATRVTICSGVTIGDDVVIGAGSVVNKSLPSGVVAAGVPCRILRPLERNAQTAMWSPWDREI